MADPPIAVETRVRFAETDMQGVVFYGTFFTYQDVALNAYLRAVEFPYDRMREAGWTTHVVHAELDYLTPARFEDVIEHRTRVERFGESSLEMAYVATRAGDGARLVEGGATHVTVDVETGDPIRVPEAFRDAVAAHQAEPPTGG